MAGTAGTLPDFRTLIEKWDGANWSIVPSPNAPGALGSLLAGVSCPAAGYCVAVGSSFTSGQPVTTIVRPLIEKWNGTAWSIAASPTVADRSLTDVTCPSVSSCTAVGTTEDDSDPPSGITQSFIEQKAGSTWSVVPSPNPTGSTSAPLVDVSCTRATSCFAVGSSTSSTGIQTALVMRWDGNEWTLFPQNNPPWGGLSGVSCVSPVCFAVGSYRNANALGNLADAWSSP